MDINLYLYILLSYILNPRINQVFFNNTGSKTDHSKEKRPKGGQKRVFQEKSDFSVKKINFFYFNKCNEINSLMEYCEKRLVLFDFFSFFT